MNCREWKDLISAYADGELSPAEAGGVAAHLAACPQCRQELRFVREAKAAITGLGAAAGFPTEAKEALLAEARRLHPSFFGRILARFGSSWAPRRGYAMGAAVCGLAILAAYAYYARRPQSVSIEIMLAAHSEYALTKPLAPEETIFARLPGRLSAADADERTNAL